MQEHVDRYLRQQEARNLSDHTIVAYRADLRLFVEYLEGCGIGAWAEVNRQHARGFLREMKEAGASTATIRRRVSTVKSFFKGLRADGVVAPGTLYDLQAPKRERRLPNLPSRSEMARVFESLATGADTFVDTRRLAVFETLYSTGMRVAELCTLDVGDVDLESGDVLIRGKGRKERIGVLGQSARDAIARFLPHRAKKERRGRRQGRERTDALFVTYHFTRPTTRSIQELVGETFKRVLGDASLSPHSLRHAFGTHMRDAGADLRAIQELLGHESLSSTTIYLRTSKRLLHEQYMAAHPRAQDDAA